MEVVDHRTYLILALLVAAWCFLHSAMISISVTDYLRKSLRDRFRFYRLFFNAVSMLSLIPLILFAHSIDTQVIFQWKGFARPGQVLLFGSAALLFFLGGRHYNAFQFLGIRQIKERNSAGTLSNTGELSTSGILSVTRHPWYLATILLIWSRSLDISAIIVNVIFTGYLIIGTYLEEKKLIREFGEQYRSYQRNVSMLFPYKWLKSKIIKMTVRQG